MLQHSKLMHAHVLMQGIGGFMLPAVTATWGEGAAVHTAAELAFVGA